MFEEESTEPAPYESMRRILDKLDVLHDDFSISLAELRRAGFRRGGPHGYNYTAPDALPEQINRHEVIAFPALMKHFERQGWNKDRSWYERVLKVAQINPLPKKGPRGAILYPEKAAKAAISDAITAESTKKSLH